MGHLKQRLDYDVGSEFGNFRVLMDLWFKIFKGDHVRVIEFYEGAYGDRDIPRHEALLELFLVALAATIIGEEYKARREGVKRAVVNLQRKCRMGLNYLFEMDALKFLEVNRIIDHSQYLALSKHARARFHHRKPVSKALTKRTEPYYHKYGMTTSNDILDAFERMSKENRWKKNESSRTNVITLTGIAASKGVVAGRISNIRDVADAEDLKGKVGVFRTPIVRKMVHTVTTALGVIGTRDAGGITGHLATVARELGIPAVAVVSDDAGVLADGTLVIVDGNLGKVQVILLKGGV